MTTVALNEIAHARSGDKGCNANVGLIAFTDHGFKLICQAVTEQRVLEFFGHTPVSRVERFEIPNLLALNFLLYDVLGKGGSRSLAIDAQGKALGQILLTMKIDIPDDQLELCRAP